MAAENGIPATLAAIKKAAEAAELDSVAKLYSSRSLLELSLLEYRFAESGQRRYAAEADVAHAGVDRLRPARGGPVPQAVDVGAQERAALDHLAGHLELRLPRVVTV